MKSLLTRASLLGIVFAAFLVNSSLWGQSAGDIFHQVAPDFASVPEETWVAMEHWLHDPNATPPTVIREALRSLAQTRAAILSTAEPDAGDVQVDVKGPTEHAPHRAILDRAQLLMLADAQLRLQNQDARGAASSIATVYAMAGQLEGDHDPTSSHLSMWMMKRADRLVGHVVDRGMVEPEVGGRLLDSMRALDSHDPAGVGVAVAAMGEGTIGWYESIIESGNMESLGSYLSRFSSNTEFDLARYDREELQSALHTGEQVLASIAEILRDPFETDRSSSVADLLDQVENDLVFDLLPWLRESAGKWVWEVETATSRLQERMRMIEALVRGEIGVKESANAAYWYNAGAEIILEIDQDEWAALLRGESRDDRAAERSKALVGDAMRWFGEGVLIERCDFAPLRRDERRRSHSLFAAPDYMLGMHRAAEYWITSCKATHSAECLNALASCLVLTRHMGQDDLIISSYVAQEILSYVMHHLSDVLDSLEEEVPLYSEATARMRFEVSQMPPGDPFGYVRSLRQTRKDALAFLEERYSARDCSDVDVVHALSRWNDDQLYFVTFLPSTFMEMDPSQRGRIVNGAAASELQRVIGSSAFDRALAAARVHSTLVTVVDCRTAAAVPPSASLDVTTRRGVALENFGDLCELLNLSVVRDPLVAPVENDAAHN